MPQPLWQEIQKKPVTSCIAIICIAVWLYLRHKQWGYPQVGTSYQTVIEEGQYWRLFVSQFSHVNLIHLLMNMSALWSLGFVERRKDMGVIYYCKVTYILMICSKLLLMAFYLFMVKIVKKEYYRTVLSIGYSSVVFGWMANLSVGRHKAAQLRLVGSTSVPMPLAPFASLIITSILIPQSSFFGHLSGILVGYLIGVGWFDWVNLYWSVTIGLWVLLGVIISLTEHRRF